MREAKATVIPSATGLLAFSFLALVIATMSGANSTLAQEPDIAEGLIAEQLVALAPAFLTAYGVELKLPEGTDLKQLSDYLIGEAMTLCEDDYLTAVENTILFVSSNIPHMGRSY